MHIPVREIYGLFIGIVPLVISAAVGWIGWLQYRTNKQKLRLDLYHRRFDVYQKTLAYFQLYYSESATNKDIDLVQRNFTQAYRESRFLYGADSPVYKILTDIKDTLGFLLYFDKEFASKPYDPDRYKAWSKKKSETPKPEDLMKSLEDALQKSLDFGNIAR
ncbi:hypothetical protein [Salinisphaera hydrothermalis]|uniref:hypothetical protein n=1 Tax=Salinisphaera hydrothermalis TaxID=563188 RepID=UPI00333F9FE8